MTNFSDLQTTPFGDGLHKLKAPLTYRDRGFKYEVPIGFVTDFASVPNWLPFRSYFRDDPRVKKPSAMHDNMYYTQYGTRKICDKRFYIALMQEGMPKFKAYIMYRAIRGFGRDRW